MQSDDGGHSRRVDRLIDQVFYRCCAVAIEDASTQDPEPPAAHRVDDRAAVREEFDVLHFQHGAELGESVRLFLDVGAHAELARTRLHAPADHEPISGLKDVQRAPHRRVGHGADKNRDLSTVTYTVRRNNKD